MILAAVVAVFSASATDLSRYIPSTSPVLTDYNDIDSVRNRLSSRPLSAIEGIWRLTDSQATVAIEPASDPQLSTPGIYQAYQIIVVFSPRRSIRPGTVLGYLAPTGRNNRYDAYLYTNKSKTLFSNTRRFTIDLTDDSHMVLTPSKPRLRFTLRHSFNFLIHAAISNTHIQQQNNDGLVKIFPASTSKPPTPVYL